MNEVIGPIIATTLVLLAVFIPASALGGMTGQLYRQFALTIATATVFSAINAVTLSPALCALVLRPTRKRRNPLFRAFNWSFGKTTNLYGRTVTGLVRRSAVVMVFFALLGGLTLAGLLSLPTSFLPEEDPGYALITAQLPDSASHERTQEVADRVNTILAHMEGVKHFVSVPGFALLDGGRSSNAGDVLRVRSNPGRSEPVRG